MLLSTLTSQESQYCNRDHLLVVATNPANQQARPSAIVAAGLHRIAVIVSRHPCQRSASPLAPPNNGYSVHLPEINQGHLKYIVYFRCIFLGFFSGFHR